MDNIKRIIEQMDELYSGHTAFIAKTLKVSGDSIRSARESGAAHLTSGTVQKIMDLGTYFLASNGINPSRTVIANSPLPREYVQQTLGTVLSTSPNGRAPVATLEPDDDPTPEQAGIILPFNDTKLCASCGERKPKSQYRWDQWTGDHLKPYCFDCDPVMRESDAPNRRVTPLEREAPKRIVSEVELIPVNVAHKVCRGCGKDLPLSSFNKERKGSPSLRSKCKECVSAYQADYNDRKKKELQAAPVPSDESVLLERIIKESESNQVEQAIPAQPKLATLTIPEEDLKDLIDGLKGLSLGALMLVDILCNYRSK